MCESEISSSFTISGLQSALPALLAELLAARVELGSLILDEIRSQHFLVLGRVTQSSTSSVTLNDSTASFSFNTAIRTQPASCIAALVKVTVIRSQAVFVLESAHQTNPEMLPWWKTHVADVRNCRKRGLPAG